jgi:hypothetical protein
MTPEVKYLVSAGSDDIIPFYRVPDEVAIANERTYAPTDGSPNPSLTNPENSPLFWAIANGFITTDDFYTDHDPLLWRGRELYIPNQAGGRLVESPSDMVGTINTFLLSPQKDINTCLVTGYDFLTDSANEIYSTLSNFGLAPMGLINEDWTRQSLISSWISSSALDLVSINAHFEHWAALPAAPFPATSADDLFYNTDLANVADQIAYSTGCHGGLNIPDYQVNPGDINNISTPDFPQVFAQQNARAWIANTGYGYGMDDAVTNSELLMLFFTENMGAASGVSIGQALVDAKQRYVGSVPAGGFGIYDEKILIESTLYGLPMTTVSVPVPQPISGNPAVYFPSGSPNPTSGTYQGDLYILPHAIGLNPTQVDVLGYGTYYSLNGEVQGSPGRPIQPRGSIPVAPSPEGLALRGALLLTASFDDIVPFDPVISLPIDDVYTQDDINQAEPVFDFPGWFPGKFWAINPFGGQPQIVVVGGQFNNDESNERLYSSMGFDAVYGDPDNLDYVPPAILSAYGQQQGTGLQFGVFATDNSSYVDLNGVFVSGVARVLVTYPVMSAPSSGNWVSVELEQSAASPNFWTGFMDGLDKDTPFFVQALDQAGNVMVDTNNGQLFIGVPPNPFTNQVGASHTLVMSAWKDLGDGNGFVPAGNQRVDFALTASDGATIIDVDPPDNFCFTDPTGVCSVTFNSSTSGKITARAEMDIDLVVDGQSISLYRQTDGAIGNSTNGLKTYVDADISLQNAEGNLDTVKEVSTSQTFIITVTEDLGDGEGPVPAVGETVDIILSAENGAEVADLYSTCDQTDSDGTCEVTFTSYSPGRITLSASSDVSVGGIIVETTLIGGSATFVDATLNMSPNIAQEINVAQTVTITLTENKGDGLGYVSAAGEVVNLLLVHENGTIINDFTTTCDSTDANGECIVTFTSEIPGNVRIEASSDIGVESVLVTKSASTVITFVDAWVVLVPSSSVQGVNQGVTFEIQVYVNDGTTTYPISDIPIYVGFPTTTPDVYDNSTCLIPNPEDPTTFITGTNSEGYCAIFINQGVPGDIDVVVTVDVIYDGLTLHRIGEGLYRFVSGKIAPTNTTCQDFTSSVAEDLNEIFYGVQDGLIGSASPGVFFYFTEIAAPAKNFNITIAQSSTAEPDFPLFEIQKLNQVWLYEEDCSLAQATYDVSSLAGQVEISVRKAVIGTKYILAVKYSTDSIVGEPAPDTGIIYNYSFSTLIDGNLYDLDQNGLNLLPR